jgi:Do/DeqQ family serine protease
MNTLVSKKLFWTVSVVSFVLIAALGAVLASVLVKQRQREQISPVIERIQIGRSSTGVADQTANLASAAELSSLFKDAASRVKDAVVYIQVDLDSETDAREGWERRFFHRSPRQSVGSGVIISEAGYIVTNNHVVQGASAITVTLPDKRQFEAKVVGMDPSTDLAVVKIEKGEDLPIAAFGNSDDVEVGQWVLAIGNPFRLTSTVTAGIVSALGRQVNIIGDSFGIEDFIQTDAAINPGNSGGALVDLSGSLVGINTAIATESGSYEGYGFAVPVNLVARVASDLIAYGEVQRGFLNVEIGPVTARLADRLGLGYIGGVYLNEVWRGGAADRAGLRIGDVVTSVDSLVVNAPNELQSAIARKRPGDRVRLYIWRRGRTETVDVILMGREDPATKTWFADLSEDREPPAPPAPRTPDAELDVVHLDQVGIGVREASDVDLRRFSVDEGIYVEYVEKDGLASQAGLRRDVLVRAVGTRSVGTPEELREAIDEALSESSRVVMEVVGRDGISAFYELRAP